MAWPGQGQTGALVEYSEDRIRKHFDLENELGSVERWSHINGNVYHSRIVVDPSGAYITEYFDQTAQPSERGGYWQWFNVDYRGSDLMLAHFLTTQNAAVTYSGQTFIDGHPTDLLTFAVSEDAPQATVYVSRKDGLIRRLKMARNVGEVNILFAAHGAAASITHAREISVFLDETLVEFYPQVAVTPNTDVGAAIALDQGLSTPLEQVDQSEMTVQELAPGLYHVGQEDYSLFAREGSGLIAVNGDAGLKARYDALAEHLGKALPLTHVIQSHHHDDHTGGYAAAAELGAVLVITKETETALARDNDVPETVQKRVLEDSDALGPFQIIVRPTSHGPQNAFILHTPSGALWQDDHYHGLLSNRATRIQPTARELHTIILEEGMDVRWLLSGHARKAETWDVFDEAVRVSSPSLCPTMRAICRDAAVATD